MNRTLLCSAIEGLVSKCGYNFQLSDKAYYPTTVCRYPAAFMSQPEFSSLEGRKHGRITYNVSLTLAKQGAKQSPEERNSSLSTMEEQAMNIFVELSQNEHVAVVEELTIVPCSEVDTHGAITIKAEAKVVTIF
ncbi:MAG: hypothetical protein E7129_06975 [Rikenellaceae bacterium]|nr:hypothetical protein [Rikenellaceae bacterium]